MRRSTPRTSRFLKNLLSVSLPVLALFTVWQPHVAAQSRNAVKPDDRLVASGEYLSRAGDCVACHTMPEGRLFAGGRPMPTPFGTLYTSNITPDPETGSASGAPISSTT